MSSEDKFKRSLDEILKSKTFPFDESDWEKASELLDRRDRKRRRIVPFVLTGILLLTGIGVTWYYVAPTPTSPDLAVVITASESASLRSTEVKEPKTAQNIPSSDKNNDPVSRPDQGPLKQEVHTPVSEKTTSGTALKSPGYSSPDRTRTTTKPENTGAHNSQNHNVPESNIPPYDRRTETANPETPAVSPDEEKGKTEEGWQPTPGVDVVDSSEATSSVTAVAAPEKADTAGLSESEIFRHFDPKPWLSFEAGGAYNFGWNYNGIRDGRGISPFVSVSYFNYLNGKIALSFGIGYASVNKLSYSSKISKVTTFGLGEENEVTVITPTTLHYLNVPLRLHVDINPENTVAFGANLLWLANTGSKVETYSERLGSAENRSFSRSPGYTEGFKQFDYQLSVLFRKEIYRNFGLGAEFYYGLTDLKNNQFFGMDEFRETNKGIKVSLVYNIFRKANK